MQRGAVLAALGSLTASPSSNYRSNRNGQYTRPETEAQDREYPDHRGGGAPWRRSGRAVGKQGPDFRNLHAF